MKYESELNLLKAALKKCHINVTVAELSDRMDSNVDFGLRLLMDLKNEYNKTFYEIFGEIEEMTVYTFTDIFECSYIIFLLPDSANKILIVGPFLKTVITKNDLVFLCEKINPYFKDVRLIENYFGAIPYLSDSTVFLGLIDAFCETVSSNKQLKYVETEGENNDFLGVLQNDEYDFSDEEKTLLNMKMMEKRYAFENELISAVSRGQLHSVEKILTNFSDFAFEERLNDKLRNYKNYCIIMNTLFRKAAESGGVHPLYIDRVSSGFAKEIESITNISAVPALMTKFTRKYCNLVRENSIKNYSAPVQKAIIFIDSDLTADLNLNHLAEIQNISPAYLSNLFHKETGETLTEFVNKRRINYARKLLDTSSLQIQTIALRCGIVDVHYFSRTFKKYVGKTPKEYRDFSKSK